jgi:sugar phosphate isomerase/epimerase
MHRRDFLKLSAGAALISRLRAAAPGIRLGYDTYSLRAYRWKAMEHLDYTAALKLDTIQISSLDDFESLEASHLAKVKDKAAARGMTIDAGVGCVCPSTASWSPRNGTPVEYLTKGLKVAKAVGAKSLRCFMGNANDRRGKQPIEAHIENTVKVFRQVRSLALDTGVTIALENHGDLQARELKALIEAAGKDYVAACMDTGNPMWVLEDPLLTIEILGPYAATTHYRDSIVYEHPRGAAAHWVAMGDGVVDLKQIVAKHAELCPQASIQLEIITGRPPTVLPYLEDDFWKAFPNANSSDFARFVALVKRGRPFGGSMIIADVPGKRPPEYDAALRTQQKVDLERSLEHSKKVLGVGLQWRA